VALRLVRFEQKRCDLKACLTLTATQLDNVSFHTHFRHVQGLLMVGDTGRQFRGGTIFVSFRIANETGDGANGQAMPRFAMNTRNADFVGQREHFHPQCQGMDGKALL